MVPTNFHGFSTFDSMSRDLERLLLRRVSLNWSLNMKIKRTNAKNIVDSRKSRCCLPNSKLILVHIDRNFASE